MPVLFPLHRKIAKPFPADWEIWKKSNQDLLDWLYGGLTGRFQIGGHRQIDRWATPYADKRVIEVGCGQGHHLTYAQNPHRQYIGLDIELKFLKTFQTRNPKEIVVQGDVYNLPFQGHSVDCVLSIYHLEHLRKLGEGVSEIHRILSPQGELLLAFPLEGGILYKIGRQLTSKRYMEKKYGIDYDAIVRWEHCNDFIEIERQLKEKFWIREKRYLPFPFLPYAHLNVIQCLRACPKVLPRSAQNSRSAP